MLFRLLVSLVLSSAIFYSPFLEAHTYTVGVHKHRDKDFSSIKKAVMHASDGDTISILPGTYTEADILIDKHLVIIGYNRNTTFLRASHLSHSYVGRIFTVGVGLNVEIHQITLSNGYTKYHGGGILNYGDLKLVNVTIKDCYAQAPGGGIAIINGSCEMENTEIVSNTSLSEGGGIFLNKSSLNISESVIEHNQSNYWGGGIKTDNSALNIENTSIAENSAKGGGGVFIHLSGATFYNVDFKNNKSTAGQGGALHIFTMEEDLSIFLNVCRFMGKEQKSEILQEAYNSNNYIFIDKSIFNPHGIVQEENTDGICKVFYDGVDISQEPLSAAKDD